MDSDLQAFLAKHVRPYDPETDDYERPPFAADIKEGKNDPIYNAHSYHTKVPPRSIIPYILHYTKPGDVVLDPFCGSGMTGVAAQMCAAPPKDILEQFPELADRVGPRACILNDLSPAACHIAYNYNTPVDVEALKSEFERIKAAVKEEFDWLYGTEHYEPAVGVYAPTQPEVASRLKNPPASVPTNAILDEVEPTWELISREDVERRLGYPVTELPRDDKWGKLDVPTVDQWVCIPAMIQYTIWSDVYRCEGFVTVEEPTGKISTRGKNIGKPILKRRQVARGCGKTIRLWSATKNLDDGFECSECKQTWTTDQATYLTSAAEIAIFGFNGMVLSSSGKVRLSSIVKRRPLSRLDFRTIEQTETTAIPHWFPTVPLVAGEEGNRLINVGIVTVDAVYTKRNLRALASLWAQANARESDRLRSVLRFLFTSVSVGLCSKLTRYNFGKRGNGAMAARLFLPHFQCEANVLKVLEGKYDDLMKYFATVTKTGCKVLNRPAQSLSELPDQVVDFVFTDPPFGRNIAYSELNILWEAWIEKTTNVDQEAITSNARKWENESYNLKMEAGFAEIFRILKPGRYAMVEFNNRDPELFEGIKAAAIGVGFTITSMLLLDKDQKTFKQVQGILRGEGTLDKDVLFNLHKPASVVRETPSEDRDIEQRIAEAVREHLTTLPARITAETGKYSDDHRTTATINSMLMNNLIPRGVSVERLNLPFIERVCARYFRKIGQRWYLRGETIGGNGGDLVTEEVAVTDELSAVAWLRQQILSAPKLTGELKPLWMRATGLLPAVVSRTLDLERLLRENFWRDTETNRWREPTAEEREKMGDDRSLRVLHDADRLASGSFGRVPSGTEICDWITVLFDTCKELEEDPAALSAHLGFDKTEAYRLIVKISHHLTAEGVDPAKLSAARKQAAVAGRRLAEAAESSETTGSTKRRKDDNQPVLDLGI